MFDSCIFVSRDCSLFSIFVQGNQKNIALKLNFFEYVFLMRLLCDLDCVFPSLFGFHMETQLFSQSGARGESGGLYSVLIRTHVGLWGFISIELFRGTAFRGIFWRTGVCRGKSEQVGPSST